MIRPRALPAAELRHLDEQAAACVPATTGRQRERIRRRIPSHYVLARLAALRAAEEAARHVR